MKPSILIGVIVVLSIIGTILYLAKRKIRDKIKRTMYQPKRRHLKLSNIEYRDLYLNVRTGESLLSDTRPVFPGKDREYYINVWYLNRFSGAKIVLYFHGNSYNISYRKYMIDICNELELNLLLVDYRGYGRSSGKPTPKNVLYDAKASYEFLIHNGHLPSNIIVWGESLGGSPACYVPAKYPVGGLILLSTFASLHALLSNAEDLARQGVYWLARLLTKDINNYTNNEAMIERVKCPVLIFHSPQDNLIPFFHAKRLVRATKRGKLIKISGDHDSPHLTVENVKSIVKFLNIKVTEEKLNRIVDIIENLSFAAHSSSLEA